MGPERALECEKLNIDICLTFQSYHKLPDYYIQGEHILVDIPGSTQSIPDHVLPLYSPFSTTHSNCVVHSMPSIPVIGMWLSRSPNNPPPH